MKKIIMSLILSVIILFTYTYQADAAMKLIYDGKVHIYNAKPISLFINENEIKPNVPPIILFDSTLVPARAVFEEMGAKVFWKQKEQEVFVEGMGHTIVLKINNKIINVDGKNETAIVPAKIINGSTMIPLRFVSEKLGLEVKWEQEKRNVLINEKKSIEPIKESSSNLEITNINFNSNTEGTVVKIDFNLPVSNYKSFELANDIPFRIVIDIPESGLSLKQYTFVVGDARVTKIRAAQNQLNPKIARVVLDMVSKYDYKISKTEDNKSLIINIGNNQNVPTTNNPQEQNNQSTDNNIPTGGLESFNSKLGKDNELSISDDDEKVAACIRVNKLQDFKVYRKTNPDSIEVEIEKTAFESGEYFIPMSNGIVTGVKYKNIDDNKGKIIFITSSQVQVEVFKEPESINIYIYKEGYSNLRYENAGALSTIILSGADVSKKIDVQTDEKSNMIDINIPEGTMQCRSSSMYINDKIAEWMKIENQESGDSRLIVKLNTDSKVTYSIRNDSKNKIFIYLFSREKLNTPKGDVLIAIDAGHGLGDPGTSYKSKDGTIKMTEDEINLDIALKLDKLFKDSGIPTVTTRSKELKQRTKIANDMKADLFISIHNNWFDDIKVSGTMTLYYPYDNGDSGLTSKRFAEIVQKELVSTINTTDKKIIPRPGLAVLNSSKMPAVLVELAFLSNEGDRKKLSNDEFKQSAAEAIYTAAIKALNELN